MRRSIISFMMIAMAAVFLMTACKKDDDDDDNTITTIPPGATTWNLNVSVDLGGVFTVVATAAVTINSSSLSAAVSTSTIGGAPEVHNFTITGTVSGSTWTVSNSSFTIGSGSSQEDVTITSGTHTANGNSLSGSGAMTVTPVGAGPINGTYTVTGSY